jgi:hypothetical protein
MHAGLETERGLNTLPLKSAVLCVDCEIVSNSPHDVCVVCGSRSLLSLVRMLGGALGDQKAHFTRNRAKSNLRYDLDLAVKVRELSATDLNATIESITRLQTPEVGGVVEQLRINVESVVEDGVQILRKAA